MEEDEERSKTDKKRKDSRKSKEKKKSKRERKEQSGGKQRDMEDSKEESKRVNESEKKKEKKESKRKESTKSRKSKSVKDSDTKGKTVFQFATTHPPPPAPVDPLNVYTLPRSLWSYNVYWIFSVCAPPPPPYIMRPQVTEHVPLHSKSLCKNMARVSGGCK